MPLSRDAVSVFYSLVADWAIPFRVRADLGVMAMKEYSISPKSPRCSLLSCPEQLLGKRFYSSAERQSAYSTASVDKALRVYEYTIYI